MKRLFLLLALGWVTAMIGCTAETVTSPTADASDESTPEITVTIPDSDVATTPISLNVPNMTCEACAASVRGALTSIEGVTDIETDITANTCSFKTTNSEIDAVLAEKAKDNAHLQDYSTIQ